MTIGFGVVGCGMISRFHAKAIAAIPGAQVVACTSGSLASATKFANEIGCRAFATLEEMLAQPEVQVVTICTPSGAHLEPAVAAAQAGKHVIVEKPLEITLERCDRIIATCRSANVQLATTFPSRFHESARLLKQAVEQGRFGRMTLGDASVKWFRTQQYYDSGAWRGTWQLDGGGALMNQAIHSVDLLLWYMGQPVEVTAHTAMLAHERIEVEDVAVATVKFESGALGVIEASTAVFPGELKRIELHGTRGTAALKEEDIIRWEFAEKLPDDEALLARMANKTQTGGGAADPKAIGFHGHQRQFENFLAALRGEAALLIDGPEGRRAVELILAIYQAAESRQTVRLPLAQDPVLQARRG